MIQRGNCSALIGLGSNVGDKRYTLHLACERIQEQLGTIKKMSGYYATSAWGKVDQEDFINQCIYIETKLTAIELMQGLLAIEKELGRIRKEKWGPRIIDLDLLYFDDQIIHVDTLTLPHPYVQDRRFVLVPLCEIAPDWVHPIFRKTQRQLLESCPDNLSVFLLDEGE
ncbi:2-amino-4-hydroxy-6-hydroxymethyldihydropteridine diphosphokinase [Cytophagales bacterium LB-30]|uniref:2-amino-4-hydroxy-6-hydroxymethyldihydropteridine pyrophosphokinase n=1 Tax=Shiella aurantiaca TaxID=3058365 RepID=A0ABT8F4W4_9BACT|nr:2-amino-4-hydroxy-6-hydroxymethyldihydropteridine diphosphokinase [Shiella aurantiaca]MDN4165428.1 2-amino-4-hydroxy-6-hydroxymethyldihydropteridine diphosphokinase [Shiella aurantiaca]